MTETLSTSATPTPVAWREIRVAAKVLRVWRDDYGMFCALDNGAVYERAFNQWQLLVNPLTEDQR